MLRGRGSLTPFSGGLCACVVFIISVFLGDNSACLGNSVTNLNPGQTINLSELVNTNLKQLETHAETHDQKVWTKEKCWPDIFKGASTPAVEVKA